MEINILNKKKRKYRQNNKFQLKKKSNSKKIFELILKKLIQFENKFKLLFVIFIFIFFFLFNNKTNNSHFFHDKNTEKNIEANIKYLSSINKTKAKDYSNSTVNRGFLKINTNHKGKFKHYDYISNIVIYKDIYDDITYTPITEKNAIKKEKEISKEDYTKLCEEGVLLDETRYKRNKEPKISVVIPYFNRGNISITMTLRSIQNQSFKDLEIIIVDDGSSEEKIKDILDAMKFDNRIILLRHKERKTTLLTRADGIRFASGEYIIQVDQDDMYLTNLLFETLYNKAKELDVDIIHVNHYSNDNPTVLKLEHVPMPANTIITQPELRTAFLAGGGNRLLYCRIRMIWDLFVRRTVYLDGIEDLGDEYMNHEFRLYEDTLMMFELSQVANSYYFYDMSMGYKHCTFRKATKGEQNITRETELLAMNQLIFMKLLLYKIDPKYDRYHVYRELGFGSCDNDVKHLNREDFDLGLEVVEAVFELERIYKNTATELIDCINKIKKYYEN